MEDIFRKYGHYFDALIKIGFVGNVLYAEHAEFHSNLHECNKKIHEMLLYTK